MKQKSNGNNNNNDDYMEYMEIVEYDEGELYLDTNLYTLIKLYERKEKDNLQVGENIFLKPSETKALIEYLERQVASKNINRYDEVICLNITSIMYQTEY